MKIKLTIVNGSIEGDYVKEYEVKVLYVNPSVLVSIPKEIELERVKDNKMFEAEKEVEIKLESKDPEYGGYFNIYTEPKIKISDGDKSFDVLVYDSKGEKYRNDKKPLMRLNTVTKRSSQITLKAMKDISLKMGKYSGIMRYGIEYEREES